MASFDIVLLSNNIFYCIGSTEYLPWWTFYPFCCTQIVEYFLQHVWEIRPISHHGNLEEFIRLALEHRLFGCPAISTENESAPIWPRDFWIAVSIKPNLTGTNTLTHGFWIKPKNWHPFCPTLFLLRIWGNVDSKSTKK